MPYHIFFDIDETEGWRVIDLIATILFVVDMFIEFNTAYYYDAAHTQIETNRVKIAWRYFTTWFLFDVIAIVPMELFIPDTETNSNKFAKLARVSRTFRMLRAFRVFKLARSRTTREIVLWMQHTLSISPMWNPLLRDFTISALVIHLFSGVWNYIALKEAEVGGFTWAHQADLLHASPGRRYVSSLYYIISSLTSVGYGDVSAANSAEELFSMVVMLSGIIGTAVIVADILAIKERLSTATKAQADRSSAVNRLIHRSRPPWALKMLLRNWVDEANARLEDTYDLLPQLPANIRRPVVLHMRARAIKTIRLFNMPECDNDLVADFLWHMERMVFKPNEFVYMQHTNAEYMYFLMSGQAVMLQEVAGTAKKRRLADQQRKPAAAQEQARARQDFSPDAALRKAEGLSNAKVKPLYLLQRGDNFGDGDVLFNDRYTSSAFTVRPCDVFALHRKDLEALCQANSQLYLVLRKKSSDDAHARRQGKTVKFDGQSASQPEQDLASSVSTGTVTPNRYAGGARASRGPMAALRSLRQRLSGVPGMRLVASPIQVQSAGGSPGSSATRPGLDGLATTETLFTPGAQDLHTPARPVHGPRSGSPDTTSAGSQSSAEDTAAAQAASATDAFKQALLWAKLRNREDELAAAADEVDQDMRAIATGRFGELDATDVTELPSVQRAQNARSALVTTRWRMAGQVAKTNAKLEAAPAGRATPTQPTRATASQQDVVAAQPVQGVATPATGSSQLCMSAISEVSEAGSALLEISNDTPHSLPGFVPS